MRNKTLEALEILRNKTTDVCNCLMILRCRTDIFSYSDYQKLYMTNLTENEYNLIKEELL